MSRPSAAYYYRHLGKPVGHRVRYSPRRGGKVITHALSLRANGSPYWRALERLPRRRSGRSRSPKGR